jgi:hypothetical protein
MQILKLTRPNGKTVYVNKDSIKGFLVDSETSLTVLVLEKLGEDRALIVLETLRDIDDRFNSRPHQS